MKLKVFPFPLILAQGKICSFEGSYFNAIFDFLLGLVPLIHTFKIPSLIPKVTVLKVDELYSRS